MRKSDLRHLDKVFWPKEGYTKGDVIEYYEKMADIILTYLKGRPMVLNRHPNGIKGKNFFQKDTSDLHLPEFVERVMIHSESRDKEDRYIVCNNKETLLYLANLGCIEMNPWSSRVRSLGKPDFLIIDLDPSDNTFNEITAVAVALREILEKLGIKQSYPKTSGKRGVHVYVPLAAKYSFETVRDFGKLLALALEERLPKLVSTEHFPEKRKGKIHPDYMRNAEGQTAAAAYSLRPYSGATVSTPLQWHEVKKGLDPRDFTIKTIFERIKKKGDIWKPVLGKGVDVRAAISLLKKELKM